MAPIIDVTITSYTGDVGKIIENSIIRVDFFAAIPLASETTETYLATVKTLQSVSATTYVTLEADYRYRYLFGNSGNELVNSIAR